MKAKFLRFVVTERHPASRRSSGLFTIAYRLLEAGQLPPEETAALREVLTWFEATVPIPDREYITERYIFWFKMEAQECIQRMWQLADLLKQHGYLVDIEKCEWPGAIIYQDEYQVAAKPLKR